jgi:hypothetical protein
MTWGEYVDLVESHLSVEATRRGMETFRARFMRNAVLDLQRYIPGYRAGNVTTYTTEDVELLTKASLGELPPQAKVKAFYMVCGQGVGANRFVTSWDELAAISTAAFPTGYTIYWVEELTGLLRITQLRAGNDATDTPAGIQRPGDYAAPENQRVWYLTP